MGFYIEAPVDRGKTAWLKEQHNARQVPQPASFEDIPAELGLLCVAVFPTHEAVAFVYSPSEFAAFARKQASYWLTIPRDTAEVLSDFANRTRSRVSA